MRKKLLGPISWVFEKFEKIFFILSKIINYKHIFKFQENRNEKFDISVRFFSDNIENIEINEVIKT